MQKEEDYRLIIKHEWADIHHSRVQEWTCLGVITGAHFGIIKGLQVIKGLGDKAAAYFDVFSMVGLIMAMLLCVLGLLMTCRHRTLMIIKLDWIFQAEEHLGLIDDKPGGIIPKEAKRDKIPKWNALSMPRFLSSSGIIFSIYIMFLLFDFAFFILIRDVLS